MRGNCFPNCLKSIISCIVWQHDDLQRGSTSHLLLLMYLMTSFSAIRFPANWCCLRSFFTPFPWGKRLVWESGIMNQLASVLPLMLAYRLHDHQLFLYSGLSNVSSDWISGFIKRQMLVLMMKACNQRQFYNFTAATAGSGLTMLPAIYFSTRWKWRGYSFLLHSTATYCAASFYST